MPYAYQMLEWLSALWCTPRSEWFTQGVRLHSCAQSWLDNPCTGQLCARLAARFWRQEEVNSFGLPVDPNINWVLRSYGTQMNRMGWNEMGWDKGA